LQLHDGHTSEEGEISVVITSPDVRSCNQKIKEIQVFELN